MGLCVCLSCWIWSVFLSHFYSNVACVCSPIYTMLVCVWITFNKLTINLECVNRSSWVFLQRVICNRTLGWLIHSSIKTYIHQAYALSFDGSVSFQKKKTANERPTTTRELTTNKLDNSFTSIQVQSWFSTLNTNPIHFDSKNYSSDREENVNHLEWISFWYIGF